MAKLPDPMHQTVIAIFAAYERDADRGHRPHLGASVIGHECARYLWLSFRWTGVEKMSGRVLRLLETGQQQEARLVADLRRIGITVSDRMEDGGQWRVAAHGGHFAGSMDAAGVGFPEAPRTWHVIEFKTSNAKAFKELQKDGVRKVKPMHFAQMQVYMHLTGMERAAYLVVNKDTDDLYFERIEHDESEAQRLLKRAESVIFAAEPPSKISEDPAWWACKFCPFHEICHETAAPAVSCRTCAHVTPIPDGGWRCERHAYDLSLDEQSAACPDHRFIPSLLARFAEVIDSDGDSVRYRNTLTDRPFTNGPSPGYLSMEIHAADDKRALGDPVTDALRAEFDGHVVTMSGLR